MMQKKIPAATPMNTKRSSGNGTTGWDTGAKHRVARKKCQRKADSNLAERFQHFKRAPDRGQRRLAGFVFDNIPLGITTVFAKFKHAGPVDFVLADDRFRAAAVGFDMNGADAARILVQHDHRINPALATVAGVELHDDFRPGVAEENVPGRFAFDELKIMLVRVVAGPQAKRF